MINELAVTVTQEDLDQAIEDLKTYKILTASHCVLAQAFSRVYPELAPISVGETTLVSHVTKAIYRLDPAGMLVVHSFDAKIYDGLVGTTVEAWCEPIA